MSTSRGSERRYKTVIVEGVTSRLFSLPSVQAQRGLSLVRDQVLVREVSLRRIVPEGNVEVIRRIVVGPPRVLTEGRGKRPWRFRPHDPFVLQKFLFQMPDGRLPECPEEATVTNGFPTT